MRAITEAELREQYKQAEFTSFQLPAGTGLTPAAKQFLSERRIKVYNGAREQDKPEQERPEQEKPEHMTHIYGQTLVPKSHPRIRYRGKLDYSEALLISIIIEVEQSGYRELALDLETILEYMRQMMRAEVTGEPLVPLSYRGLSAREIREHSHNPKKYYGVAHIFPQPRHGRVMAELNILRTQCRELELLAMDAFHLPSDVEKRPDILQSLNRLSSLVYILMLQMASGRYKAGG